MSVGGTYCYNLEVSIGEHGCNGCNLNNTCGNCTWQKRSIKEKLNKNIDCSHCVVGKGVK